ncbi:MAG TPA: hypothetical protein VI479_07220 [Blastocatellia bacterium]
MDGLTMKATLAIGVLLLIGFLWLMWKFFYKVFKHVVIMLVIAVLGSTLFIYLRYSSSTPRKNPDIGKHAYMKDGGAYIGVVEGEDQDSRRGAVWVIRPLGGYPQRYSKKRVTLKEKIELKLTPTEAPTPVSAPASNNAEKKDDAKKKKN